MFRFAPRGVLRRAAPAPPRVEGAEPGGLSWPVVGFVWAHRIWPWSPSRWAWATAAGLVYLSGRWLLSMAPSMPLMGRQLLLTILPFATLAGVYGVRWIATRRHVYATRDARLVLSRTRRGWLVIEHVARPGVRGAGTELRKLVSGPLTRAADAQGVTVYAYTRSLALAARFMDDIPGLRVAGQTEGRYLLVRPPATTPGGSKNGLDLSEEPPSPAVLPDSLMATAPRVVASPAPH
ncbi:hypothetical protein ACFC14_02265 [Microbacterium sp. NPDC055988]|uniref:hypothetical protein n=1 Tax=Microbacterium sp. NPDC055988 TaxID=3345671 RepID=UPI0035D853A9